MLWRTRCHETSTSTLNARVSAAWRAVSCASRPWPRLERCAIGGFGPVSRDRTWTVIYKRWHRAFLSLRLGSNTTCAGAAAPACSTFIEPVYAADPKWRDEPRPDSETTQGVAGVRMAVEGPGRGMHAGSAPRPIGGLQRLGIDLVDERRIGLLFPPRCRADARLRREPRPESSTRLAAYPIAAVALPAVKRPAAHREKPADIHASRRGNITCRIRTSWRNAHLRTTSRNTTRSS